MAGMFASLPIPFDIGRDATVEQILVATGSWRALGALPYIACATVASLFQLNMLRRRTSYCNGGRV